MRQDQEGAVALCSQIKKDPPTRRFVSQCSVRIFLFFVVLCAGNSQISAQNDNPSKSAAQETAELTLTEITKAMMLRLGSQFPLSYSSNRVSPTVTQINVKWPTCYGARHASILSSFCVPSFEAGNNASASSITFDVQSAGSPQFTVFIVSDDDEEGQVERFWAAEATNRFYLEPHPH
jgi:hypothetical protein